MGPRRSEIGPSPDCELVTEVPDDLDEVFEAFSRECNRLMMRRSANYWNWRYGARPHADYRTLLARQDGRVVGAVVTSVQQRKGLDFGLVLDLITSEGVSGLRHLLRAAEDDLRSRGIGLVTCQATSPMLKQALTEERYRSLTRKQMGRDFHFIYRITGLPGLHHEPKELDDWHYTFGDSDNT
jgi:hypothetical protein